jgi:preprotein translocase subunit Sss1
MQEQPKESISVAAFGVAVIGGLGFLVGLMF